MQILTVNVLLAVLPALLLLRYFYRQDTLRPEPKGLIGKAVLLGMAVTIPAGIIEAFISPITSGMPQLLSAAVTGFIIAAGVEETSKYLLVRRSFVNREEFDETTDGIVYTIAASMGFALLENILYSYQAPISTALVRGVTAVPLHAVASGVMGYYIGAAKFDESISSGKGLLYAILIHGAYDFFLMTETLLGLLIIPVLILSWRALRRLYQKAQLEDRYYGRS